MNNTAARSPKQTAKIVASLRDQLLDVKLGTITPAEWIRNYDSANLADAPHDLTARRAQFEAKH